MSMRSAYHGRRMGEVAKELPVAKVYNHATGSRATAQAVTTAATVAAPQTILFSNINVQSGNITMDSATGNITLPAGTYLLQGGVGSAGVSNQVCFQWYIAGSAMGAVGAVFCPTWTATNAQLAGPAVCQFTSTSPTVVRLCVMRVLTNTNVGGQTDATTAFPWFTITQLP